MAIVGTQPMHMDYVVAAANLRANLYGIPQNRDYSAIVEAITLLQFLIKFTSGCILQN